MIDEYWNASLASSITQPRHSFHRVEDIEIEAAIVRFAFARSSLRIEPTQTSILEPLIK